RDAITATCRDRWTIVNEKGRRERGVRSCKRGHSIFYSILLPPFVRSSYHHRRCRARIGFGIDGGCDRHSFGSFGTGKMPGRFRRRSPKPPGNAPLADGPAETVFYGRRAALPDLAVW